MDENQGTRENLLAAAIDVIDQNGMKAVRVRDIAARAGVKESGRTCGGGTGTALHQGTA